MKSEEIRQKFRTFFESKEHGSHKWVESSSLVPENDSSVLFTTAGMQQFKPYYLKPENAPAKNVISIQKCVRTSDIEGVGDDSHLTFFEMLGNFSFGGYGREEAITYAHDFITKELGLEISYVTFYKGNTNVPKDEESKKVWERLKVKDIKEDGEDVFWGPTGNSGPCGPTTEIYCKNAEGKDIEIWNIVFNKYFCDGSREDLNNGKAKLTKLPILGVDTGMGLERLLTVVNKVKSVYETDLFNNEKTKEERIVADHLRTARHLVDDGVTPSNIGRGYILRRLIRRAVRYSDILGLPENTNENSVIRDEETKFRETLKEGVRQLEKGVDPFTLFTTYGFPFELTKELAKEKGIKIDEKDFQKKFEEHQEISKAGMEQKFKGGLAGHSEMEIKYHTATHLLHQALKDVLGEHVEQKGSNITRERLRFDFVHTAKMTDEEKKKVEDEVNKKIKEALPVNNVVLPKEEAMKVGARHLFSEKYGDDVSIYFIGKDLARAYSKEFCGGPHVKNTSELGHFKIAKEEAVAQGIRRIKAVLE